MKQSITQEVQKAFGDTKINQTAVQRHKEETIRAFDKSMDIREHLHREMAQSHVISFVAYAVRYHRDTPKKELNYGSDQSFLEFKFLFEDKSRQVTQSPNREEGTTAAAASSSGQKRGRRKSRRHRRLEFRSKLTRSTKVAQGRGGAGKGRYTYAAATHKSKKE